MSFFVNYEGSWRLVHTEVGQGLARVVIEPVQDEEQSEFDAITNPDGECGA